MKILMLIPNNGLGGAEQYLLMIAKYFQEENLDIYFFYKKVDNNPWSRLSEKSNVNITFFSKKSERSGIFKFFRSMTKNKTSYDVIFTSNVMTTGLIGLLRYSGSLKTKRFVGRESTSIFLRYKGLKLYKYLFFYKTGYKKLDLLICQTDLMAQQLIKNVPYLEKKIKVLHNPINIKEIGIMSEQEISFDFGVRIPQFIVSAGRFIPEKGFDILIKSFTKLKKDKPNLKLVILGIGPLKASYIRLAEENNLLGDIYFPGYVQNVYPFFKKANLCVVSSIIEGFPNVLLQMMSQNDKVVSTLCAGGIDKIHGIQTVETNSVENLYRGMLLCLNTDTKINRKLFDNYLEKKDISAFMKKLI
ncbi:glycosyltransferase [Ulvibacterium marinum]|uniref:glycosyltransferase n=1 Tax=Ulvibacterium marinum TaxID=2419782 RepID=UPI0024956272|nr:glycosyltransferase [Ulvibacterium marinum]